MPKPADGLYIMLISVHGLIRANNLELGRDADTGGQTKYVVEVAEALGKHPEVKRVDLVTRLIYDKKIHADYAQPLEKISSNVNIVRLQCGPRRYLRKEVLWPYLDGLVDNILQHVRKVGRIPDIVHGHYADAGYVGTRLVQLLGMPLVFTGHSLGRVKRARLLEKGSKESSIENQYNFTQRIEAEEITLGNANIVITSTHQEVEQQYALYDNYQPRRMTVVPPGVDLSRFNQNEEKDPDSVSIFNELKRFLNEPDKPIILAISRPDERKNIASLIKAYASHEKLQSLANLVIVAGNRDDISTMEKGPREVLSSIILLIDKYDLYGRVAYPKHHDSSDIEALFRGAARLRGVFINPALTEPFGLTLIEAAACGLPLVATHDGGPRDIIGACKNGILINPLDINAIADALYTVLSTPQQWDQWSKSGVEGAHKYFSWQSHVDNYLKLIKKSVLQSKRVTDINVSKKNRLPTVDRMLVCDVDNTLTGDQEALDELLDTLKKSDGRVGFAVATGRTLASTLKLLQKWNVPTPDLLITSVGSDIYYGHRMIEDENWLRHIDFRWQPDTIKDVLQQYEGLRLQAKSEQGRFKISYDVVSEKAPNIREISASLRKCDVHAKIIYSNQAYLDLLPVRASKGLAVRYIALKWGIRPEEILVAGDSGNDEEMLKGNTLGVVVGNYSKELSRLKGRDHIYFAKQCYSKGVLEGMQYYGFLDDIITPAKYGVEMSTEETV